MWERLEVELLLLCIEQIQLRWFRHLVKMLPIAFSGEKTQRQTQNFLERIYILYFGWSANTLRLPLRSWWN